MTWQMQKRNGEVTSVPVQVGCFNWFLAYSLQLWLARNLSETACFESKFSASQKRIKSS